MAGRVLMFTPKPAPEGAPALSPLAIALAAYDAAPLMPASPSPELCEGRTIWNSDGQDGPVLICPPPPAPAKPAIESDRDATIAHLRATLKRRTGRPWSVTGGKGTAWGWIKIDAPPARCTWRHVLRPDAVSDCGMENYDDRDSGRPGGHMAPSDRDELRRVLDLDTVHTSGISIPASHDYRREYIERAEGRPVTKKAEPYWD